MTNETHPDPAGDPQDGPVPCYEHVWVLRGIHLSLRRGAELHEQCGRCGAVSYRPATYEQRPAARRAEES